MSGKEARSRPTASIRPDRRGGESETNDRMEGGRLSVTNASLRTLILNAYDVLTFQIAGGPRWLDSERYDVEAKTGRPERPGRDEMKLLLQNQLNDRFRLRVHWETRQMAIYALEAENAGLKLSTNSSNAEPSMIPSRGHLNGTGILMAQLAKNLGNQLGQVVVDQTGLMGGYDFTLE